MQDSVLYRAELDTLCRIIKSPNCFSLSVNYKATKARHAKNIYLMLESTKTNPA